MRPDERWLGDAAYTARRHPEFIGGRKKPKGGELTAEDKTFNAIHGWYRTTVEHSIGILNAAPSDAHSGARIGVLSAANSDAHTDTHHFSHVCRLY